MHIIYTLLYVTVISFCHLRLQEIEAEFDKHVCLKDIVSQQLDVDTDAIIYIYNYWKLKRRVSY